MNNNALIDEEISQQSYNKYKFLDGIKSAVPIALGYILVSIAFGILSKSAGIPNYISILMSLMVYAGAGQFMAANLIFAGASPYEIVLAELIINLRHFLYTATISQRLEKGLSKKWTALLSYGITDETFAVASIREEQSLNRFFLLGLNLLSYFSWTFSTIIGVLLGDALPASLSSSMGIALYSMFIALLVPSLKKSKIIAVVACIAMICHSILRFTPGISNMSSGWSIIISTIAAAFAGALIFPKGVNNNE
ncbi:MAG: hypothetical protein K0R09_3015 [Clostridiales bacterium]|jgi:4-azaleucine resistance transporter AzlC|nr:hypothetical protein [Clostridiales bacterium]